METTEATSMTALVCPYCGASLYINTETRGPAYLTYEAPESIECCDLDCDATWEPNGDPRDVPRWVRWPDLYAPPTRVIAPRTHNPGEHPMKKIPTLFVRDPNNLRHVTDEVTPGCEWVLAGEGRATRKYDGTCVMLDEHGAWWARREVKPGKTPPPGWVEVDHDPVTGKRVGWEPIAASSFQKFHAEALEPLTEFGVLTGIVPQPGTYELIGPKINGNPEKAVHHRLESHANAEGIDWVEDRPDVSPFEMMRDIVAWLADDGIEGVVWHHPDGRMAKLKGRDFPAAPSGPTEGDTTDG